MRRAADSFGRGARRDATLRLLASEAAAAGAPAEAAAALEGIAAERLIPGDRLMLAKCYQRTGRDHKAIGLLEAARNAQILSDEGALLLFAMGRHRKQKEDLAVSLERGARAPSRRPARACARRSRSTRPLGTGAPPRSSRISSGSARCRSPVGSCATRPDAPPW
jgi:hypothetical protein